jgi:hypothetical protein
MDSKNIRDIFIKQKDIKREEHKLEYNEIMNTMPDETYSQEQEDLKQKYIEWRWRFFQIGDKKFVEISSSNANNRKYFDKYGRWTDVHVDPSFNQYLTKQTFYYTPY